MTFGFLQTVKKVPYTNWLCQQFRRRTGGWMLFEEGALFPARTSDRRRVARADRMCELEWILLSHDKLKLRKNGPMESGSICTVASPMERRASLILFLLLGLFATAGIE